MNVHFLFSVPDRTVGGLRDYKSSSAAISTTVPAASGLQVSHGNLGKTNLLGPLEVRPQLAARCALSVIKKQWHALTMLTPCPNPTPPPTRQMPKSCAKKGKCCIQQGATKNIWEVSEHYFYLPLLRPWAADSLLRLAWSLLSAYAEGEERGRENSNGGGRLWHTPLLLDPPTSSPPLVPPHSPLSYSPLLPCPPLPSLLTYRVHQVRWGPVMKQQHCCLLRQCSENSSSVMKSSPWQSNPR